MKIFFMALGVLLLANPFFAFAGEADREYMVNDTTITTPELLTQKLDGDVVYGSDDAPVTVVEYASLSCSHCGGFYNTTFADLKTKYIENGKVKFIYRHFPLNLPALQAAMIVGCMPDTDAQKKMINTLFSTQEQWAYTQDFNIKLRNISRIAGMEVAVFNDCISDTGAEEALLARQLKAQQGLVVRSTPTLFINGAAYDGAKSFEEMVKIIDGLL